MLLKLTGILSEILFIALVLVCRKKEKSFDFRENTFSYFGSKPRTKKLFNIGLFFIILIRIIFASRIFLDLYLWKNIFLVFSGIIAFFGALAASIFSTDRHSLVHRSSANISAVFSTIFIFFVGLSLINNDLYLAIFNLTIFVLLFFLTFYLFKAKKVSSIFQIMFFLLIIIWDNVMTLKLFNII